ncbi:hypothetical protein Scep_006161 [Stephania cephalantha]|uniref:C3H1-type domain-containing protein n=1 Tax=Stephania cephalantha TaxID=152367 RepID=A0AAP0K915_9MAGN
MLHILYLFTYYKICSWVTLIEVVHLGKLLFVFVLTFFFFFSFSSDLCLCYFSHANSCLKGEDCPFNHQLSKHASNHYKSNKFYDIKSIESSNLASTSGQRNRSLHLFKITCLCILPKRCVKETSTKMPIVDPVLKTKEQTTKGTYIIRKRQLNNSSPSLRIVKKIRETTSSTPSSIENLIHKY